MTDVRWRDGKPTQEWTRDELVDEIARLRVRLHEQAEEANERLAPFQTRCAEFDTTLAYATRYYADAGNRHWMWTSQVNRVWTMNALIERNTALDQRDAYLRTIGQVETVLDTWHPSRARNSHQEHHEIKKAVAETIFEMIPPVQGATARTEQK